MGYRPFKSLKSSIQLTAHGSQLTGTKLPNNELLITDNDAAAVICPLSSVFPHALCPMPYAISSPKSTISNLQSTIIYPQYLIACTTKYIPKMTIRTEDIL
jgi:hypothetical protein